MKRALAMIFMMVMLSGCHVIVNMGSLVQQDAPEYRDKRSNKGGSWPVCGGRVVVVNESSYRIQVGEDRYSPNASIVRQGVPYRHVVVEAFDQYGQLVGRTEKTFLCNARTAPERWIITDPKLWWQQQ